MRGRSRWPWWAAAAAVLAAGVTGVSLWGTSGGPGPPPSRARVYSAVDACLLTGSQGIADPSVTPVWSGMQDASLATRAKVSYLAVSGPDTAGNALPFLGSLLVRHCNVIVADGAAEQAAVDTDAARFSAVRFVVVGTGAPTVDVTSRAANVTVVGGPRSGLRAAVAGVIIQDVTAAPG